MKMQSSRRLGRGYTAHEIRKQLQNCIAMDAARVDTRVDFLGTGPLSFGYNPITPM